MGYKVRGFALKPLDMRAGIRSNVLATIGQTNLHLGQIKLDSMRMGRRRRDRACKMRYRHLEGEYISPEWERPGCGWSRGPKKLIAFAVLAVAGYFAGLVALISAHACRPKGACKGSSDFGIVLLVAGGVFTVLFIIQAVVNVRSKRMSEASLEAGFYEDGGEYSHVYNEVSGSDDEYDST
jgi:hypothetical protein